MQDYYIYHSLQRSIANGHNARYHNPERQVAVLWSYEDLIE